MPQNRRPSRPPRQRQPEREPERPARPQRPPARQPERQPDRPRATAPALYLIETIPGLEPVTTRELRRLFGRGTHPQRAEDGLLLEHAGSPSDVLRVRTAQAAYLVRRFPVPRPKALLGDQALRTLIADIEGVMRLRRGYETLHLSAAGSDSSVMQRLKQELATRTGLTLAEEEAGDLLLRIRRASDGSEGWEALIRLSPRPLATRRWRVCNLEGALNAAAAHAMVLLSNPTESDRVLNLACGSGTLLIERLSFGPAASAAGCDLSPEALRCAAQNLEAAGYTQRATLEQWDATALPLPDASIDVLLADLPFGHLVGSHAENLTLYPALLTEAARVAADGARCVLISHEIRLLEQLLSEPATPWIVEQVLMAALGGLHPRIFVLHRKDRR